MDSRERLRLASVLLIFGAALATIGVCGAFLRLSGSDGFGWYQRCGVAVGALVAICGALLRAELLALAGAIIFGLSAGIDFVATERYHNGAWLSYGLCFVGLLIMLGGLLAGRKRSGGAACSR